MIDNLKKNIMDFFRNDENSRSDFILPRQSDVFARNINGLYTFGIPGGDYLNFYEEFNSCILATGLENNKPYLYFSCRELSEEFVTFCLTSFIPKEKREEITSDPAAWFEKISSIFGNSLSSTATSDKIAELYVFWQMKCFGLNITFGGYNTKSLRDIQCEGFEVEIKSTLNHHVWPIHTNPEQIGNKKEKENYYLVLCRLEKTETPIGENCYSLNSLKNELRNYSGCEDMLSKLPRSTSLLNQMYIIRDIKVFTVDENFPSVTLSGESNGAVLKNFVLELNPDVLNAKILEDFLLEKGGKAPEAEEVEEVVSFEQDEEEKITQNDTDVTLKDSIGFASFQTYEFSTDFKNKKIKQLIVPGITFEYKEPAKGKQVLHDFFKWFWEEHRDILEEKIKENLRYAKSEENLKERYSETSLDLYVIAENECYFHQRLSLAEVCKEMQKLLKEAYGDELNESFGIHWINL